MHSTPELISELSTAPNTVRQHNAITSARYDYTACQLDIFFFLLSKLRRDDPPQQEYTLFVKDIEALTGRKWNYQQLREATANMGSRMLEVESDRSYQQLWMFQRVEYVKGQGCLQIQLAHPIRPYLFDLQDNFTSYQLHSALKLSSKYAKRIYQLVSQWRDKAATRIYLLDELKQMLHLKDPKGKSPEQFQNISQLKARVLDVAVRQVNEHTDLRISYTLLKRGRAYDAVLFTVAAQHSAQLPLPFGQSLSETRAVAAQQHLDALGIRAPHLVAQILASPDYLEQLLSFIYLLQTGRINAGQDAGALFLKRCGLRC